MKPILTNQYQQGSFSVAQWYPGFNIQNDPYAAKVLSLLRCTSNGFIDDIAGVTWSTFRGTPAVDAAISPWINTVSADSSMDLTTGSSSLQSNAYSGLSVGSGPYTVEMWVQAGRNAYNPCIFCNTSSTNQGINIFINYTSANYGFIVENNVPAVIINSGMLPASQRNWTHIAVCRNSNPSMNTFAYLNGVCCSGGASDTRTFAATPTLILGNYYTGGYPFSGYLAGFRLTAADRYTQLGSNNQYAICFNPLPLPWPKP